VKALAECRRGRHGCAHGDDPSLAGDLGVLHASDTVQAAVVWYGPSDLLTMAAQSHPQGLQDHDAPDAPEKRLTAAGARSELRVVPGADHCFLGVEVAPLVDKGLEFLDRELGR
jgi:dienelactone hydrolase